VSHNSEAAWLICFAMHTRTSTALQRLHQNPYCMLTSLNLYVTYECFVRKAHYIFNILNINHPLPIRVAARSQAWIYGRSFGGIAGSNPAGLCILSLVSVVCCYVQVSVSGSSVVQRSPTECSVCSWVRSWSLDNEEALGLLLLSIDPWDRSSLS
jgi:hypothetical protein